MIIWFTRIVVDWVLFYLLAEELLKFRCNDVQQFLFYTSNVVNTVMGMSDDMLELFFVFPDTSSKGLF